MCLKQQLNVHCTGVYSQWNLLIWHLCNPFPRVIQLIFFPFDHLSTICFLHCVIWHLVFYNTEFLSHVGLDKFNCNIIGGVVRKRCNPFWGEQGLPSWLWVTTHSSASWCTPVRTPRDSSLHCSSSSWTWSVGTPHPPRPTPAWWESLHDPAVWGTPRGTSHRTGSPRHWPGSVQVKTKADARFSFTCQWMKKSLHHVFFVLLHVI